MALELLKERSVATERRCAERSSTTCCRARACRRGAPPARARPRHRPRPAARLAVIAPGARRPRHGDRDRGARDQVLTALRRRPWCAFAAERGSRVVALLEADAAEAPRNWLRVLDGLADAPGRPRRCWIATSDTSRTTEATSYTGTRVLDLSVPGCASGWSRSRSCAC
jgi:hypothetical protein